MDWLIDEEVDEEFRKEQHRFYNSMAWLHLRDWYRNEMDHECERCGRMCYQRNDKAYIRGKQLGQDVRYGVIHHKEHLTEETIKDNTVALNQDNLELLCTTCHNQHHHSRVGSLKAVEVREDVKFDEGGNLIL